MISRTSKQFRALYLALPHEVQSLADKAYAQWLQDPTYPGLQFKQVDAVRGIYSVRIGLSYRALGVLAGDTVTWFWIGKHEVYDRKLRDEEAGTEYSA